MIGAESDEEAVYEATTMQQFFLNVVRGAQNPLCPPVEDMEQIWSPAEKAMVQSMISVALLGSKNTIRKQLIDFQDKYHVDEIMAVSYIYDPEKQRRSYEILKEAVLGQWCEKKH